MHLAALYLRVQFGTIAFPKNDSAWLRVFWTQISLHIRLKQKLNTFGKLASDIFQAVDREHDSRKEIWMTHDPIGPSSVPNILFKGGRLQNLNQNVH